ncbi:hypothetical protein BC567DRAFT_27214 [Phyllosticta citribraziliensis]
MALLQLNRRLVTEYSRPAGSQNKHRPGPLKLTPNKVATTTLNAPCGWDDAVHQATRSSTPSSRQPAARPRLTTATNRA